MKSKDKKITVSLAREKLKLTAVIPEEEELLPKLEFHYSNSNGPFTDYESDANVKFIISLERDIDDIIKFFQKCKKEIDRRYDE